MATRAELAKRDTLTPSELQRFGDKVHRFDFQQQDGEEFIAAKHRLFREIDAFIASSGGQLYTGIHSEYDWSRERCWSKGAHFCNRTLNFVVIG